MAYWFLASWCLLVVAGILVILIGARASAKRNRKALGMPPPFPDPAITTDGFWLRDLSVRSGSIVRYRYLTNDGLRTSEINYDPGPNGVFVYTGLTPSDIHILAVRPPVTDSSTFDTDTTSSSFWPPSQTITPLAHAEPPPPEPTPFVAPAAEMSLETPGPSAWLSSEPPAY